MKAETYAELPRTPEEPYVCRGAMLLRLDVECPWFCPVLPTLLSPPPPPPQHSLPVTPATTDHLTDGCQPAEGSRRALSSVMQTDTHTHTPTHTCTYSRLHAYTDTHSSSSHRCRQTLEPASIHKDKHNGRRTRTHAYALHSPFHLH